MKRKTQRKFKGKDDTKKLQKLMNSIDEFVQSNASYSGADEVRNHVPLKKKSRKDLRKEKRKLKRAKKKHHVVNKSLGECLHHPPLSQTGENVSLPKQQTKHNFNKSEQTTEKKNKVNSGKPEGSQKAKRKEVVPKKSRLQESRKKALLEANVSEDREIKKLERCLGLSKRKNKKTLPQSFIADGLDYILGAIEPGSTASGLYESDEEMDIRNAKDNFEKLVESEHQLNDDEEEDDSTDEEDASGDGNYDDGDDNYEEDDDQDSENEEMEVVEEKDCNEDYEDVQKEENDSGEPTQKNIAEKDSESKKRSSTPGKYLPPHLRETADGKRRAELERLTKNVKGLVNRLSEPNVASISAQLEELYMSHSRKDMNETLTGVMLAACVGPALMPERLLMEHVLLVSVLHHNVGLEVGAHFLETTVQRFEETYQAGGGGKESENLLAVVGHLYNFGVVHSLLLFDILKKLASTFTGKDVELILAVLRNVGFGLRKDDASSLRELITEAQRKASALGETFQDQTRVRFMLETMLALKNNDMRKIPGYNPEPVERLRRLERTLVHRSAGGSDMKLRVSLENLLEAEQVGRWWIVGSSWSGAPMIGDPRQQQQSVAPEGKFSAKVLDLARKQRMNTDIRRNIFCVLMTSEDYLDAFEKLLSLGLRDQQEREIIHVLLDCCLQEKVFNPFYAVLGEKFGGHDRRFQMTLQFTLWDKFKELQSMSGSTFRNLVELVLRLLQKKTLSISVLKVIEFGELDKAKVRFLRSLLTKLLRETDHEQLADIFGRISGVPRLGPLREGLKLFISHFLLKAVSAEGGGELTHRMEEGAQVATKAMDAREARLKL